MSGIVIILLFGAIGSLFGPIGIIVGLGIGLWIGTKLEI